jgi:hypothetical protein
VALITQPSKQRLRPPVRRPLPPAVVLPTAPVGSTVVQLSPGGSQPDTAANGRPLLRSVNEIQ